MKLIYKKLEDLRNDKNFSQQEFADIVGRTREWYANIQRTKNMRVDDLEKIADYFHLPVSYFFTEKTESRSDLRFSLAEEPEGIFEKDINRNQLGFLMEQLKVLKDQLEKKDGQIEFLQRVIEDLTDKS